MKQSNVIQTLILVTTLIGCGGSHHNDKPNSETPSIGNTNSLNSQEDFASAFKTHSSKLFESHCTVTLKVDTTHHFDTLKAGTTYLKSSSGFYINGDEYRGYTGDDSCGDAETIFENLILTDILIYKNKDLSGEPICSFKAGEVVNGYDVNQNIGSGINSTNFTQMKGTETLIEITRWDAMKKRCDGATSGFAKGSYYAPYITVYKKK